jgi:hypothetical protein
VKPKKSDLKLEKRDLDLDKSDMVLEGSVMVLSAEAGAEADSPVSTNHHIKQLKYI